MTEQTEKILTRGHGSDSAQIMFVADGASSEDISSGYAITGLAEDYYRGYSKDNSIAFDSCWRTALIKERINLSKPDFNRPLLEGEAGEQYKEILRGEIQAIRPNVIVPLAELSFNFLTGLSGIRKFRGSVLPLKYGICESPIRVLPILGVHPYLNEDVKMKFITRADFAKLAKAQFQVGPIEEVGKVWIATNGESVRNYFTRQYSAASFVTFDIETFANIPTCISFCFDGLESCCIPLVDYKISLDDRVVMMYEVAKMLASPIPKVNQNIKFDWRQLERWGFIVNNVVGDTMIAAGCLYAEFPKNLGFLTSLYTDMPYFKDEGKEYDPAKYKREQLYIYNAKDSLAVHQIYPQQMEELVEKGCKQVYDKLIQLMPIYKKMEETGIRVDEERRHTLLAKYWNLFDIQLYKLKKLAGYSINPLSDKQVNTLIYDELKFKAVPGVKKTKSGAWSTDEESLELLAWVGEADSARDGNEIIKTIVACRKLHKVIEYLETTLHPDGRMRCEYNLVGTKTGRTNAGETTDYYIERDKKLKKLLKFKLVNLGKSFQTISKHGFTVEGESYGKDLRDIFVPSIGYDFVECDLSQAEARVDAVLAADFDILSIFDTPTGIHRLTGSWVYNCDPSEIKKGLWINPATNVGEDRYHVSKTVRHAGERNMKEDRLVMMLHKPRRECFAILKRFHDKQPNIRQVFHREITKQVKESRTLIAPNGRRRDFYGRIDDHTVNEAISVLPQAIVGDQLKFSFIQTYAECADWARPIVEAHDGNLAEVKKGRKEEFARIFEKNVCTPIDFESCSLSRKFKLIIPMEAEWSNESWGKLERLEYK